MASESVDKLALLSSANGDVPGGITTTYTLTVEAPVLSNIDADGDQDWYRFEAKAGSTYVFSRSICPILGCEEGTARSC